ncbi:hypothetical protein KSS87_017222 [Heliosperma pusillum]|nr:hypothetical protein KSS87_017222 [Heliosperma pusillum]
MAPLAAGGIVVCDTELGLLKVTEDGVTSLVSQFNESQINFADDVIEAKDGNLYFSVASTKYGFHEWNLDVLEAIPHGQLLKYNSKTDQVSLLLDNLGFANGVALSKEEDYLLICESWKFRCLKYWLNGELEGTTELSPKGLEFTHTSNIARHVMATFPRIADTIQAFNKRATVVKVSENGKILAKYDDPNGKVLNFVTSAFEHEGYLYLGSLKSNFIGMLPIV